MLSMQERPFLKHLGEDKVNAQKVQEQKGGSLIIELLVALRNVRKAARVKICIADLPQIINTRIE